VNEKLSRLAAIQEGLDDVAAGRAVDHVDHEEAMREIRAEIARARAAQP
jgi:predicted transcriptional regulator